MDTLSYVGHATALIRLGGTSVLTDPILRRHLGPLRRQAPTVDPELVKAPDLVLISHLHRDHLDFPSLRRLPMGTRAIVPRGAADLIAGSSELAVSELSPGETTTVNGLAVTATEAVHDGRRERWGGIDAEPLGYVIEGGGRRVYFAGDTDLFDGMAGLAPLDLALLPVWGWGPAIGTGHLDPVRAAESLSMLRPRLAVPIHWGTFYPAGLRRFRPEPLSEPPLEFERTARELCPEVEVRVLSPGEGTEL